MTPIRTGFAACLLSVALAPLVFAAEPPAVEAEARVMLEDLVAFPTTAGSGAVPRMADYLRERFLAAGFAPGDIEIVPAGESVGMLVRYRGATGTPHKPAVFIAHMDVVTVQREDWDSDPWKLTEKNGALYGRGVVDNKYGVLTVAQAFMRLKREGFVPDRDLVAAFTGDEETGMLTTQALAKRLEGAAFALNADAGGGFRPADGKALYVYQASEKTYVTFELSIRNAGGHSSAPRKDNAIYELATALQRIAAFRFPAKWNDISLGSLAAMLDAVEGESRPALEAFIARPGDEAAVKVLQEDPYIDRELRTTCVATMLRAGTAENALPASATATVNCRLFPGETVAGTLATLKDIVGNPAAEFATLGDPVESPVSEMPAEALAALEAVIALRAPGAKITPYQEAGGTDGLRFRRAGIPTIGVGPLFSTADSEYNFHGNNERLPLDQFRDGLDHMYLLIRALASP
jgi:carboxypeptidase PM20D1